MALIKVKFYKVLGLPSEPEPNAFYFVENGDIAETYVTTADGEALHVGNSAMVLALLTWANLTGKPEVFPADLEDAELTGTPSAPTADPGTNTNQIATTAFIQAAMDSLIDAAPGALNTLNELAAALGDDENFAATITTALAGKQPIDADLTTIAALNSATASVIASEGSGWVQRTYAQLKTLLSLVKGDVGLGNVDNVSDADKPVSTAQQAALDLKAPLADPAFTGNPTAPTQTSGNNTTRLATTAFVQTAVANLINSAPGALDTLDELAAAFGDDPNFAATMTTALAGKQPIDADLTAIAGLNSATAGVIASEGSGWAHKTFAQLKALLSLVKGDVGLGNVDNTSDATKNAATVTLTNKRVTRRVLTITDNSATPAINTDNCDVVRITGQSANITSLTSGLTGTPVAGDTLWFQIVPTGTITIAYGASYENSSVEAPTEISGETDIGFRRNPTSGKWRCVAVA